MCVCVWLYFCLGFTCICVYDDELVFYYKYFISYEHRDDDKEKTKYYFSYLQVVDLRNEDSADLRSSIIE